MRRKLNVLLARRSKIDDAPALDLCVVIANRHPRPPFGLRVLAVPELIEYATSVESPTEVPRTLNFFSRAVLLDVDAAHHPVAHQRRKKLRLFGERCTGHDR